VACINCIACMMTTRWRNPSCKPLAQGQFYVAASRRLHARRDVAAVALYVVLSVFAHHRRYRPLEI